MSIDSSREEIIKQIAERADFSFDKRRLTDMTGNCFAGEVSGTPGPYHEETRLFVAQNKSFYFFFEEDIAPMAGYFKWIILKVRTTQIKDDEELKILCEAIKKRRFNK